MQKGWEQIAAVIGIHLRAEPNMPSIPSCRRTPAFPVEHAHAKVALTHPLCEAAHVPESVEVFEVDQLKRAIGPSAPQTGAQSRKICFVISRRFQGVPKGVQSTTGRAEYGRYHQRFGVGPDRYCRFPSASIYRFTIYLDCWRGRSHRHARAGSGYAPITGPN